MGRGAKAHKSKGLMRIYIQNVRTGEFYDGNGNWTDDEGKAFYFSSSIAALNFCQTLPKHLQVIMGFESPASRGLRVTDDTLRC